MRPLESCVYISQAPRSCVIIYIRNILINKAVVQRILHETCGMHFEGCFTLAHLKADKCLYATCVIILSLASE